MMIELNIVVVFINILQVETWQACEVVIATDMHCKSSFFIFRSIYLNEIVNWHCTSTICEAH